MGVIFEGQRIKGKHLAYCKDVPWFWGVLLDLEKRLHLLFRLYESRHFSKEGQSTSRWREVETEIEAEIEIDEGSPGGSILKNPPANAGDRGSIPGSGRPSGERATYSSTLAWKIPGKEEPGGLQSMGPQKSWTRLSHWKTTT